jgi:hypothetical protein
MDPRIRIHTKMSWIRNTGLDPDSEPLLHPDPKDWLTYVLADPAAEDKKIQIFLEKFKYNYSQASKKDF